jgi:hypothetical protein
LERVTRPPIDVCHVEFQQPARGLASAMHMLAAFLAVINGTLTASLIP